MRTNAWCLIKVDGVLHRTFSFETHARMITTTTTKATTTVAFIFLSTFTFSGQILWGNFTNTMYLQRSSRESQLLPTTPHWGLTRRYSVRPSVSRKAGTTGVELPATSGRRTRAISASTAYKTCPTSLTKMSAFSSCKVFLP